MSEILNMLTAKNKALFVIESCRTNEQIRGAKNYIELFHGQFNDFLSYTELKRQLESKKEELNIYGS